MSARTVFSLDVKRSKNVLKISVLKEKITKGAKALDRMAKTFLPFARTAFRNPHEEILRQDVKNYVARFA